MSKKGTAVEPKKNPKPLFGPYVVCPLDAKEKTHEIPKRKQLTLADHVGTGLP
jgi:hypothetical protein